MRVTHTPGTSLGILGDGSEGVLSPFTTPNEAGRGGYISSGVFY